MKRSKKEEIRKHNEARKDLSPEQIQILDAREGEDRLIKKLAKIRHVGRFSEEYDFIYDSHVDVNERKRGINPMDEKYIAAINEKRKKLGVSPLSESGHAQFDETMLLCLKEAGREIGPLRTRIDEILFYKWDPLRLSNSNTARDEYTSYVEAIFKLTLDSESVQPLADHLTYISTETIGVAGNRERDNAVAELIFSIVHDREHYPDHVVVEVD